MGISLISGGRKRPVLLVIAFVLVALLVVEGYRALSFYRDVTAGVDSLRTLRSRIDVDQLDRDEPALLADRRAIERAADHLEGARSFADSDPLLGVAGMLPVVGKQADGVKALVHAADQSAATGLDAVDLALAFARYEPDPQKTAIEEAVVFLDGQEEPLARTRASLDALVEARQDVPDGLIGPMDEGVQELDDALVELEALVRGYERAQGFLPELLGYYGERRYLLLPQNNTELFPSGGLISSYGILTINAGRLEKVELEYFGTLYERWQSQTHEYVEPPAPLKHYLKKNFSWALGEAGWYPDFTTTADLATDFVMRGGAPETDGTIAIDMFFMKELLGFLGPIKVPEYDITVDKDNFDEVALQYTRNEYYEPGQPKKAFLSYLAREVMTRLLTTPKDRWVDMLTLLDRMGRERHLQLDFNNEELTALSREYGFAGGLRSTATDYALIADTSVNSTKLNLILNTAAALSVSLTEDGAAHSNLTYKVQNPFPEWQAGRDPELVRALMLDGIYGCYLRVYVPRQARLQNVTLNGRGAGPEEVGLEFGRAVFGRYFRVNPGDEQSLSFEYESRDVVVRDGDDYVYTLQLRKQAGTDAVPVALNIDLPPGAELMSATVDGKAVESTAIETDLREDRLVEVRFKLPS